MDIVAVISRLAHILSAIVLVGGATFTLFALRPAAKELPEDIHEGLRERIAKKWRMILGIGILLLLITGFYNYLIVMRPLHKGDGPYHMLMGIKILLALGVFFLASALAGRSKGLAWIRKDAQKWLTILVLLATIVVGIASVLKVRGVPVKANPPEPVASITAAPAMIGD